MYILEKSFSKNLFYSRIMADFEADNEIEDSEVVGNKTSINYKQNPMLNGYYILSELENVFGSAYCESLLGYDNNDWYKNEVKKLENKMSFYFKNTKKDIARRYRKI